MLHTTKDSSSFVESRTVLAEKHFAPDDRSEEAKASYLAKLGLCTTKVRTALVLERKRQFQKHIALPQPKKKKRGRKKRYLDPLPVDDDVCVLCQSPGELIMCDGCTWVSHLSCLTPPLSEVPSGDWFCPNCNKKSGEPAAEDLTLSVDEQSFNPNDLIDQWHAYDQNRIEKIRSEVLRYEQLQITSTGLKNEFERLQEEAPRLRESLTALRKEHNNIQTNLSSLLACMTQLESLAQTVSQQNALMQLPTAISNTDIEPLPDITAVSNDVR